MATSASTHAQLIQASWARCREHGLQPQSPPDFDCLTRTELDALLERRQTLLRLTRDDVLPQYAHLLGNASYLVMLADASGCLLDTWGSRRFVEPRQQHGFSAGAHWHERGVGTNALGTALVCAEPIHVARTSTSCARTVTLPAPQRRCSITSGSWSGYSMWRATATCQPPRPWALCA